MTYLLTEQEHSLTTLCSAAGLELAPHHDFPVYRLWLFKWASSSNWIEGGTTIELALQAALRDAAFCIAALNAVEDNVLE